MISDLEYSEVCKMRQLLKNWGNIETLFNRLDEFILE